MIEMLIFLAGIYSFVFGSLKLPWGLSLSGWRARVAALFLMAPLPVVLYFGREVLRGLQTGEARTVFVITELVLSLAGVGGAILFARFFQPRNASEVNNSTL